MNISQILDTSEKGSLLSQEFVCNIQVLKLLTECFFADLLRAVLSIVIPIAVDYPYAFAGHFRVCVIKNYRKIPLLSPPGFKPLPGYKPIYMPTSILFRI